MFELSAAELRFPDRYNNDRGALKKKKKKKRKLYPRFDRNISLLVVGKMMACMTSEKRKKVDEAPNRLSYWKWNLETVYGRTKIKTYIGEIINSGRDILNSAIDSAKFQSPQPAPMPKPGQSRSTNNLSTSHKTKSNSSRRSHMVHQKNC
jgi:hypothetical protein